MAVRFADSLTYNHRIQRNRPSDAVRHVNIDISNSDSIRKRDIRLWSRLCVFPVTVVPHPYNFMQERMSLEEKHSDE